MKTLSFFIITIFITNCSVFHQPKYNYVLREVPIEFDETYSDKNHRIQRCNELKEIRNEKLLNDNVPSDNDIINLEKHCGRTVKSFVRLSRQECDRSEFPPPPFPIPADNYYWGRGPKGNYISLVYYCFGGRYLKFTYLRRGWWGSCLEWEKNGYFESKGICKIDFIQKTNNSTKPF